MSGLVFELWMKIKVKKTFVHKIYSIDAELGYLRTVFSEGDELSQATEYLLKYNYTVNKSFS